ncbi:MAG: glycoside hydrolase family 113 [Phycisphaeraceae bacterium]
MCLSRILCIAGVLCSLSLSVAAAGEATSIRGVTVSCFRWGPGEWDMPAMKRTLGRLDELGSNAVTIHPYARIRDNGTVGGRKTPRETALRPSRWADERGLTFMLKPHFGYWGSSFAWRGEIAFGEDDAAWDRFFDGYERFIFRMAELAELGNAEWFVVGTELGGTVEHEARWREIIAGVRDRFSGKLTYAANWDTYRDVPFWDALDAVGVQGYFPFTNRCRTPPRSATGDGSPPDFVAEVDRPVLFTELGYDATLTATSEPWHIHPSPSTGRALVAHWDDVRWIGFPSAAASE